MPQTHRIFQKRRKPDARISSRMTSGLDKRDELRWALPPSLEIVTLTEFFEVFDRFELERPRSRAS
jgi:hypothetical protein